MKFFTLFLKFSYSETTRLNNSYSTTKLSRCYKRDRHTLGSVSRWRKIRKGRNVYVEVWYGLSVAAPIEKGDQRQQ